MTRRRFHRPSLGGSSRKSAEHDAETPGRNRQERSRRAPPVGSGMTPPEDPPVSGPTDDIATPPTSSAPRRSFAARLWSPRVRIVVVVVLAVAAGLGVWLRVRGDDESSSRAPTGATAVVTQQQLASLASLVAHPVFWLGPKANESYELTQTASGKVYVRYLPKGVQAGSDKPYLTVATYPFPGAFPAIQLQAARKGALVARLASGGIAVLDQRYPQSVHIAYPGVDYQVEVYDPQPVRAMQLVSRGQLAHLGELVAAAPRVPTAASVAELEAVAKSLGHPVYWAGPRKGVTYELTRTTDGKVYIRYLPRGTPVGDRRANYLTVATYPFPNAFKAVKRAEVGAKTIALAGGGVAVVDGAYPKSIHLAYPGVNYQVEVYDPSSRAVRKLVAADAIAPVP